MRITEAKLKSKDTVVEVYVGMFFVFALFASTVPVMLDKSPILRTALFLLFCVFSAGHVLIGSGIISMLNHLQFRRVLTGLALITICTPFLVLITSAYNLVQDYLTVYIAGLVFLSFFSIATVSTAFLSRF